MSGGLSVSLRGSLISTKTPKREGGSFPASAPGLGCLNPVPVAGPQVWSRPFKLLKRGWSKVAISSHSLLSFTSWTQNLFAAKQPLDFNRGEITTSIEFHLLETPLFYALSWVVASYCSHSQPGCSGASEISKPCIFCHSQGSTARSCPFWECGLMLVLKPVI